MFDNSKYTSKTLKSIWSVISFLVWTVLSVGSGLLVYFVILMGIQGKEETFYKILNLKYALGIELPFETKMRPTSETLSHPMYQKFSGIDDITNLFNRLGIKYVSTLVVDDTFEIEACDLSDLDSRQRFLDDVIGEKMAPCYIRWIGDEIGYGVFAEADIKAGSFIGEYAGKLSKYSLDGTWAWSTNYDENKLSIDAQFQGNELRFINHDDYPNIKSSSVCVDGHWHLIYVAKKDIKKDQQLLVSYGQGYWYGRKQEKMRLSSQ